MKVFIARFNYLILPSLLATLFFIIFTTHTLYRHFTFNSHPFDLGIYTQAIYLYGQGQLAFSSLKHMILLADHFGLILAFLSPIYKLFPQATTLLIIQSLFVTLSSIPIYLIAIDKIKSLWASLLLTISYLTSVGILSAINFDFHLSTISVLPLSLILYSWYFKKWKLYWSSLLLSVTFKEDVPLFILGTGLFVLIQKQIKLSILTMIFALASLYLIKFVAMPLLWKGAEAAYIQTSNLPLDSPIDLINLFIVRPGIFIDQIFNSPIKMQTINELYRQFIFLPFLSPLNWLTVFPSLFFRFSSTYTQAWTNSFHHSANLIPFLAISAILVIDKFRLPTQFVSYLLVFLLLTSSLSPHSFIWSTVWLDFNTNHYSYIRSNLEKIPSDATISAQSPIIPHLANRERVYLFPEIYDAQYLVLDKSLSSYPMAHGDLENKIAIFSRSTNWKIFLQHRSLIIFQRI